MSEPKYTCMSVVCNSENLVSHSEVKTFRGMVKQEEINTYLNYTLLALPAEKLPGILAFSDAGLSKTMLYFSCHSSGDQDNFLPLLGLVKIEADVSQY